MFSGPDDNEDAAEVTTPTRQFSLLEITSGPPDDSREADERAEQRTLRDLRGRVKAARAAVATTPGLVETLARDGRRAAAFPDSGPSVYAPASSRMRRGLRTNWR